MEEPTQFTLPSAYSLIRSKRSLDNRSWHHFAIVDRSVGQLSCFHRKIIGKNMVIIVAVVGYFMMKLYSNNRLNGLIDFLRFGLV